MRLGDPGVMPEPSLSPPCDPVAERAEGRAGDAWARAAYPEIDALLRRAVYMRMAVDKRDAGLFRASYDIANRIMGELEALAEGYSHG